MRSGRTTTSQSEMMIWQLVGCGTYLIPATVSPAHYEESDAYGVAFEIHTRKDRNCRLMQSGPVRANQCSVQRTH